MINEPIKLFTFIVLFLHLFINPSLSLDNDKISRDLIKSSICYNSSTQSELVDNLSYPLTFDFLYKVNFTIMDSILYIFYPGFCTMYPLTGFTYGYEAPLSSIIYYIANGSLNYDTFVPIICDQPCISANNQGVHPDPIHRITNFVNSPISIPIIIPIGMNNLIDMQDYKDKLQTLHSLELKDNITTLYNKGYPNNESYSDDPFWVLQDGHFILNNFFFNFHFCPFPYCRTENGIYPPKYLQIYSISEFLSFGCEYDLPFTYQECSQKREAICVSDCPETFSVYVFNGVLNLVNNNGVIIFQNTTTLGSFNWTITNLEPVIPPEDPDVILNEGIAWAGFALGLLLYLLGIIYCCKIIYTKCCSDSFTRLH